MINYKNPSVILLPDATGIDLAIQYIQIHLGALPWLEKSFGRAIVQREAQSKQERETRLSGSNFRTREIIYPEVYQEKQEPLNVMCNDNLKSYSFFVLEDPATLTEWRPLQNLQPVEYQISIIFWLNLKRVDPAKDYRWGEELKTQVLNMLARMPMLLVARVFETYEEVYKGFTLTETYRQYLKPPYFGFRVEGKLLGDVRTCDPWPVVAAIPSVQPSAGNVIQFVVGDPGFPGNGAASFTDDRIGNKHVVVFRNTVIQRRGNPGNGNSYYEKPPTGAGSNTITFIPALALNEEIQIVI